MTNVTDVQTWTVCNESAMRTLVDEFSERFRKLDKGELLALALQRRQLESSALIALDSELAARSLGETALHEFEDQLRTEVEPQAKAVQHEELLPPSELPSDWFDEEVDLSTASLASLRPKGVTAGAFMLWCSGIITISWGAWTILEGESSLSLAIGVVLTVLGILSFVAGSGLWRLDSWGRTLAEILCWLGLTWDALSIIAAPFLKLHGFAVDPWIIFYQFIGVLWQSTWAIYLGSKKTRQAFCRATQERPSAED